MDTGLRWYDGVRRDGKTRLRLHDGEQAQWHALNRGNQQPVEARVEHREDVADGFTKRYGCKLLVWFEMHDRIKDAIMHERRMKEWRRAWKISRIVETNPDRRDLYPTLA